jgi:hypothetical protein
MLSRRLTEPINKSSEQKWENSNVKAFAYLDVQVHEDGVYVSFQMTVTRDGTTNTINIIAILIGLFNQPRVSSINLENTMVSNWVVPPALQREVTNLVLDSWTHYEAGVLSNIPADQIPAQGFIMQDGKICNPKWGC